MRQASEIMGLGSGFGRRLQKGRAEGLGKVGIRIISIKNPWRRTYPSQNQGG